MWKTESVKSPSIVEPTDVANRDNSVSGTDFWKVADILIEKPERYEVNTAYIK